MATFVRRMISKKVLNSLGISASRRNQDRLGALLKVSDISKKSSVDDAQFILPSSVKSIIAQISREDAQRSTPESDQRQDEESVGENLVQNIDQKDGGTSIRICPKCLAKVLLPAVHTEGDQYGRNSEIFRYRRTKDDLLENPRQKVVFEYSSPNIAKPFHAGHLRSTILGNVLANLSEASGHMTTRLNYLGDWGTQFGILCVGFERYGNQEDFKKKPMEHLLEVYVKVNSDITQEAISHGKTSTPTQKHALEIFRAMEEGHPAYLEQWKEFRDLSIEEYKHIYQKLGIQFDEYHGESMYLNQTKDLLEKWHNDHLLQFESGTGVGYIDVPSDLGESKRAKVVKSDGASLYLTRDVAAILDRYDRYQFDRIHYVVDSAQSTHFKQLSGILEKMKVPWLDSVQDMLHVPFGRVSGMSSRQGNVVFLKDIIDEAKIRMAETIASKDTSKPVDDPEALAEVLGISAILVQTLKERRMKTYTFSWDRVLNMRSDSGVFLQYAHARLCSLLENCGVTMATDFDPDCLIEPEAQRVLYQLISFDTAIHEASQQLEPCILAHYSFKLVHLSNVALYNLPVKGQPNDVAQARLWLFMSVRQCLRNTLHIFGIPALSRI